MQSRTPRDVLSTFRIFVNALKVASIYWFSSSRLFVFDCLAALFPASSPFAPSALVVDQSQAVKFALDIASGMAFLHTLEPMVPRFYLNSKHIMVRPSFWLPVNAAIWTSGKWKETVVAVTVGNADDPIICT